MSESEFENIMKLINKGQHVSENQITAAQCFLFKLQNSDSSPISDIEMRKLFSRLVIAKTKARHPK